MIPVSARGARKLVGMVCSLKDIFVRPIRTYLEDRDQVLTNLGVSLPRDNNPHRANSRWLTFAWFAVRRIV